MLFSDVKICPFRAGGQAERHSWSRGRISACHAGDPGSIPGECTLFASTTCCYIILFFSIFFFFKKIALGFLLWLGFSDEINFFLLHSALNCIPLQILSFNNILFICFHFSKKKKIVLPLTFLQTTSTK